MDYKLQEVWHPKNPVMDHLTTQVKFFREKKPQPQKPCISIYAQTSKSDVKKCKYIIITIVKVLT